MRIQNTMQTNGTILNEEWCRFFKEHNFLIGLILDGPQQMHDAYRVDKGGKPTFEKVMAGLVMLKKHQVEFNILTTVHAANTDQPLETYRFLRDNVGVQFIQFIPIVERKNQSGLQEGYKVTKRSVSGKKYGQFLNAIFDELARRDVGKVFVQIFDVALEVWYGQLTSLCIFGETCGTALALEHNGDLFSCDHYVEPNYLQCNIHEQDMLKMVGGQKQIQFGLDKRDTLPQYCQSCNVKFICNGGCPKNRILRTPDGEEGLNYLCEGYKAFFTHIDQPMKRMVQLLRVGRSPAEIMF